MEIGNIVIPREGKFLTSGCSVYTHAICVSIEPFVLVSEHTDMMWSQMDMNDIIFLCKAQKEIVESCMKRLK